MRLPTLSTLFAFVVIAIAGYEFALPAVGRGVRVQIVYGVFLSNALVIAYLIWFVGAGGLTRVRAILAENRVMNYALLITALGLLGIVSAAVNQTSALDIGQAGRILSFAAYFVLLVYWSRTRSRTFALRAYLIGFACGGVVNLYYTFAYPQQVVFGVLPILYLSNGSGGSLGMAVALGALLWILRESRSDARVAFGIAVIGTCAVALSYSKTAMLIGLMGVLAWSGIVGRLLVRRGWAPVALAGLGLLATIFIVALPGVVTRTVDLSATVVQVKFGNLTPEQRFGIDDYNITGARYAYWPMTAKVLAQNPIAGVGYGGLYDAYTQARTDYEEIALRELDQARTTNPHNSFLYVIGANGTMGLVVVVLLFTKSLRLLFRCCAAHGLRGRVVWVFLAGAYLIYGFTLPTLFNTEVLYLPVAVAIANGTRSFGRMTMGVADVLGR